MCKLVLSGMVILLLSGMLSGCGSNKLADNFEEGEVKSAAQKIVDLVNKDDFETIINERSGEVLQKALTVEDMRNGTSKLMEDAGEFQDYKNISVFGEKDKSNDQDYAVAVVIAQYENQKVTYTISFDLDMKLIGVYAK